jgi:uncharacterized protein (TIGR00159 family)
LVWFRETASRFVLVGIGLLGVVYILSRFLQLYLTAVVLQGFFAILLVALVVIFQEELRRFFERLAMWGKIRKSLHTSFYHQEVDAIAHAVANLTQKRVGALIVIKGKDPLDRHLEGGVPLNGLLSQPLLESIFDPHSIGHDGAAIIDGNRLVQFGCHLPLSLNSKKSGQLGLRHTAALGLSERSDALCIVVSEERGMISVARGERLDVLSNVQELGEILKGFYAKRVPRARSRPLSGWIRKNFREKLAAIVLASILWLVFGYQRESIRRDFVVPIEYRNLSAEWMIEEPKITEAKLLLIGPEQAFRLLDPTTLKVSVDLTTIHEGKQKVPLTRDVVRIPSNLSLGGIKPDAIQITAYHLLPIEIPIEVNITGEPPGGLAVQRIEVIPPSVTVLIPSKLRGKNMTGRTEPINLREVSKTTTIVPKLIFPSEVRFVNGKPPGVKVTIELQSTSSKVPPK